jgi:hypothetical protein
VAWTDKREFCITAIGKRRNDGDGGGGGGVALNAAAALAVDKYRIAHFTTSSELNTHKLLYPVG